MDLHPLDPLGLHRPVERGWARSITTGPKTVEQVLDGARAQMRLEDEVQAYREDPLAYVRAYRRRHRLWDRLFSR
jgi:hypothetical protein